MRTASTMANSREPNWTVTVLLQLIKLVFVLVLLLARILAFSAHPSQKKNTETEFRGNRKVALLLSWWRGKNNRLMPQELRPPPQGVQGLT